MEEPLESVYFNWLYTRVAHEFNPTPTLTFNILLRELQQTEFVWFLSGDDNRAEDGKQLRLLFANSFSLNLSIEETQLWMQINCSMLEMLIALADRAEFQTGLSTREWFWIFIENLGLKECNDASGIPLTFIKDAIYKVIWRTYDTNGLGGLFPLDETNNDQRKVELWYQLAEYINQQEELLL